MVAEAMTSAETSEQWQKRGVHRLLGGEPRAWLQIGDEPEHESEIVGPEWLIDRIIADHRAAAAAGLLLAALRREVEVLDYPNGMHRYIKGLHDNDCLACKQRERLRAAIAAAEEAGIKSEV